MDKELVDFLETIEVVQELQGRNDHRIEKFELRNEKSGKVLNLAYFVKRNNYNYWNDTDDFLLIRYRKSDYIIELFFYDKYKEIYRFKEVDQTIKMLNKLIL